MRQLAAESSRHGFEKKVLLSLIESGYMIREYMMNMRDVELGIGFYRKRAGY